MLHSRIHKLRHVGSKKFLHTIPDTSSVADSSLLKELEAKLYVRFLEDWYKIPRSYLKLVPRAATFLKKYPTIEALVRASYPDHKWDSSEFVSNSHATNFTATPQLFLERIVRALFPGVKFEINARSSHGLVHIGNLEIDIYIPELRLGFEFQDIHHYFPSYGYSTLAEYQMRDKKKMEQSLDKNITIINVPFWWDWEIDSLVAAIKLVRPDLLQQLNPKAAPLTEEIPPHILEKYNYEIPDLGTPMLAVTIPRSKLFDPTNWWIFEKYDGIRGIWHGPKRQMYSRWGTPLNFPNFIVDSLPCDSWLDGEIWFGKVKNTGNHALKISSRAAAHIIAWEKFEYMVFDCPSPSERYNSYATRYLHLLAIVPKTHPFAKLATFELCASRDDIESVFFRLTKSGSEGIILRDPTSIYESGYSTGYYKNKGLLDAEALVLQKITDSKFLCRVNKIQVMHNSGEKTKSDQEQEFVDLEILVDETSDKLTGVEIEEGNFVSFRYGAPYDFAINPKIFAVRHDIQSWEQLMHGKQRTLTKRIWTPEAKSRNVSADLRAVFDSFAEKNGFDSLTPENWYKYKRKDFPLEIQKVQNSMGSALMRAYPEVSFDETKFYVVPHKHWQDLQNRRMRLEGYAAKKGFDPLVPQNWYSITRAVLESEVGSKVLSYVNNSPIKLVMEAFPNIGLEVHKFYNIPKNFYNERANRKIYFDNFAASNGFNPLIASNWYLVPQSMIKHTIINLFGGSMANALLDTYPNIGLQTHLFPSAKRKRAEAE